jgi:hypothetical protein
VTDGRGTGDTALYFPYISVPQSVWFTQVLLYWEDAASIIPASVQRKQHELSPYTHELIREGLLRSVMPEQVLRHSFTAFSDGFLALLQTHQPLGSIDSGQAQLIHEEKMGSAVYRDLEDRGLARLLTDSHGWWLVEFSTAALYMAYLTGAVCGADSDLFPVTDSGEAISLLGRPAPTVAAKLRSLRYETLTQVLPAPSRPVSAVELRRFKERHNEDLKRLRRHLNGQIARIAAIEDPDLRDATKDGIFQSIEDDVARLREQMTRRHWPRIIFVGFAGVVAATMAAVDAIITPGNALIHGLGIGSTVIAMSPSLAGMAGSVRSGPFDDHSPFVYAAAVAQAL